MSIFKSATVPVTAPTAAELAAALVEAQKEKSEAVHDAEVRYRAEESYVVEAVQSRLAAIKVIADELEAEDAELQGVLASTEVAA